MKKEEEQRLQRIAAAEQKRRDEDKKRTIGKHPLAFSLLNMSVTDAALSGPLCPGKPNEKL